MEDTIEDQATRFINIRVMLVEDEGLVAMNAERMLQSLGCTVVGLAARVPHAFEKLGQLEFDVAMLDVNLGGTMGYQLAADLHARGIPFFFATGYDGSALPADFRTVPLVRKPYNVAELARAMNAALQHAKTPVS
jgi:CheY-like chemotaxis protein